MEMIELKLDDPPKKDYSSVSDLRSNISTVKVIVSNLSNKKTTGFVVAILEVKSE